VARRAPRSDFDTAWKELLQRHFEPAMAFFFPEVHREIDWTRGVTFDDKELQYAVRRAGRGRRTVDVLARVWLKPGRHVWILLHVEVQNQVDPEFEQRMFICNTGLFSRHKQCVVSLGILGDIQRDWRPSEFAYGLATFCAQVHFPIVKLLDFEDRWEELEQSTSIWAKIVMAHLKTQTTRADSETRLQWKKRLFQGLLQQGVSEDEIVDVFRFLDLVMTLPPDLETEYQEFVAETQEEQKMAAFLANFEKKALAKGRREGKREGVREGAVTSARTAILDALDLRFQRIPAPLKERIQQFGDAALLRDLYRRAITVGTLEEFEKALP